ncbi:hypothetical protein GCM10010149_88180 [Nonomuraea roseoviolacea subsp. roseoviolacea]|uniref:winged helix-turn-helix domain-containing protein n=1 Tax=Nonomuraea roseoviolacea TaxID=103837 RepID=UPI0031DA82E1
MGTPKYLLIAHDIVEQIKNELILPGEQLPTTRKLMEEYEISQTTATAAMMHVVEHGYAERIQGKGTFAKMVKPKRTPWPEDEVASMMEALKDYSPRFSEDEHIEIGVPGRSAEMVIIENPADTDEAFWEWPYCVSYYWDESITKYGCTDELAMYKDPEDVVEYARQILAKGGIRFEAPKES